VAIETSPRSNTTPTYRRAGFERELITHFWPEIRGLWDVFLHGLKTAGGDAPCMGYRPIDASGKAGDFLWYTYNEIHAKVLATAQAVVACGAVDVSGTTPETRPRVGLFSKNRWEWAVADLACAASNMVSVPLYDTLGEEAIKHILTESEVTIIYCGGPEVGKLAAAGEFGKLQLVVSFDEPTEEARTALAKAAPSLRLTTFEELMASGAGKSATLIPATEQDWLTVCYTSGTTGMPKGAILSHGNLVSDLSGACVAGIALTTTDRHLCYLPLAHVFERVVSSSVLVGGACMGFYQGDTTKLLDDIKALKPTIFPSVPRLYNRIHDRIRAKVAAGGKEGIFNRAYDAKRYWLHNSNTVHHTFWDMLVFKKLRRSLGFENCHLMVTGAAPIAPHVLEFLRIAFGCAVVEGYGSTESCAAGFLTDPAQFNRVGDVGTPMPCLEVRLEAVEEMGYLPSDTVHGKGDNVIICRGRGEICIRGPNVFQGYLNQPEKTAEALDEEGWLHTGDIGIFLEDGALRIVDRKKNIFKLAQGEYVAAEKLENVYMKSKYVGQVFVHGDSLHSRLVAIVVPDEDVVKAWATSAAPARVDASDIASIAASAELQAEILKDWNALATEAKFQGFERIKAVHVEPTPWMPGSDVMTPTFKLKRPGLRAMYDSVIDAMYAKIGDTVAGQEVKQE
jgi:long-chain acyl-CoA synthetase